LLPTFAEIEMHVVRLGIELSAGGAPVLCYRLSDRWLCLESSNLEHHLPQMIVLVLLRVGIRHVGLLVLALLLEAGVQVAL